MMNIITVANTNQLPSGTYEGVMSGNADEAERELERIAKRKGEELGKVYNFSGIYWYAEVKAAAK
jgi:hypothetical protein